MIPLLVPCFPSIVVTRSGKLSAAQAITDLLDTLSILVRDGKKEIRLLGFDKQELNLTQMKRFVVSLIAFEMDHQIASFPFWLAPSHRCC